MNAPPNALFRGDESNLLKSRYLSISAGLVLALALALFASASPAAPEAHPSVKISRDATKLPPEVQRMRQAILQAVTSGDIEQLRLPIDMNEIHPVFAKERISDPIAYLKSVSGDGNGREMLAILFNLLTSGYAIANEGAKDEMIVWPYHAAIPLNALTPAQEVEIYRFMKPSDLKEMIAKGKYAYYSIGISRDGVWHYFTAD